MLTPDTLARLLAQLDQAHETARVLSQSNIITAAEYTAVTNGLHAAWALHQEYARLVADIAETRRALDTAVGRALAEKAKRILLEKEGLT